MARIKLSPPWDIYYREVEELFREDPEVRVVYDEDENVISLYVDNQAKAEALTALLPAEKEFGNVKLFIKVIPSNVISFSANSVSQVFDALEGNGALSYIKTVRGLFNNDVHYVVFKNKVVQYFNDSLFDVNGLCSTLYQNIAEDVFEHVDGVFYCTDVPNNGVGSLGKPLGEWPRRGFLYIQDLLRSNQWCFRGS